MRASAGDGDTEDDFLVNKKGNRDDDNTTRRGSSSTVSAADSEDDDGWFGAIGADFRSIACTIKDTAGGVANFVHRSAVAVAAEIAELENIASDGEKSNDRMNLPWQISNRDEVLEEDSELKSRIFALSGEDQTFLHPHHSTSDDDDGEEAFVLDDARVDLIRQLLEIDDKLASVHARLSGRNDIRETIFWKNYFYHVEETRKAFLKENNQTEWSANQLPDGEDATNSDNAEEDSVFVRVPTPPPSAGVTSVGSMVMVEKCKP